MRKLRRSVYRHIAYKYPTKTKLVFHYLWKEYKKSIGKVFVEQTKVHKRKSLL